jgi:hypothetical protein
MRIHLLVFLKMAHNHKNFVLSLYVSTTYCFVCHVYKISSKKFANFSHFRSSFVVVVQAIGINIKLYLMGTH